MNLDKTIELNLVDVYQLLISELRYGYTRNNHLMPSCAYDRVKDLITRMYKEDHDYALYTLKQVCEECITHQLVWNFPEGYDDEFNNRFNAIKFIRWCLDWIHTHGDDAYLPYCYDQFINNLNKDLEKRYVVYEVLKTKNKCVSDALCLEDAKHFIFRKVCGKDGKSTYYNHTIKEEGKHDSYKYEICYPVEKTFIIKHI